MNKSELVKALAEKAEITQKDAAKTLDAMVETIQQALAKEQSTDHRFWKF